MKQLLICLLLLGALSFANYGAAQQSQDFGEYVVHYNALNTNLIPPPGGARLRNSTLLQPGIAQHHCAEKGHGHSGNACRCFGYRQWDEPDRTKA